MREVVLGWIKDAGKVPTEELIEQLRAVAWEWAPHYRPTAVRLVAAGRIPTRATVCREFQLRAAARAQVREQRRAEAAALAAELGPDAAAWVRRYRDHHDHGPLWSELGRALELPHRRREPVIQALHHDGWITSTRETRSLRPGPRADADTPPSPGDVTAG